MQAMLLQEDGSAEPCTVLISGISYHYLFRNHADSFEATEPGGVFVNGSRIMDSLILPSDIDSDWMFWQDNTLWCDAAGEQLIALLHRGADGGFAETGTPVLLIAPAETKQEAQALLQSLRETRADDAERSADHPLNNDDSAPSHRGGALAALLVGLSRAASYVQIWSKCSDSPRCQNPQPILRDCHGRSRGLAMTNLTV